MTTLPTDDAINEFVVASLKQRVAHATLSMTIRDLNIESLELPVLSAEEHFGVEIDADGIEPDRTLRALCGKIQKSSPCIAPTDFWARQGRGTATARARMLR